MGIGIIGSLKKYLYHQAILDSLPEKSAYISEDSKRLAVWGAGIGRTGPCFASVTPRTYMKASEVWWQMLVIQVLQSEKQVDPWASLTSQYCLLGEFQTNEKPSLK